MSNLRANAKLNGLYALRGSWIKAILGLLIIALLDLGLTELDSAYRGLLSIPLMGADGLLNSDLRSFFIELVFTVLSFLIMAPLSLGLLEWYWNLTGGKPSGVGDIFAWYGSLRMYAKSLLLNLVVFVRSFLWQVLTLGAPIAMLAAAEYFSNGLTLSGSLSAEQTQRLLLAAILFLFGCLLLLGGVILLIYIMSRYLLAYFLVVEDSTRSVRAAVRDSIALSRPYRWEITKFVLSYIGWFISCMALLPILYVAPYFLSALSVFSKHIIYSQRVKNGGAPAASRESA